MGAKTKEKFNRNARLIVDFKKGWPIMKVAIKYDLTPARIYAIVKRAKENGTF